MIGVRIKQLREQKGYSLTKLAKEAKISKSYLSNLERQTNTNPSLSVLSKIATALDLTTNELIQPQSSKKDEYEPLLKEASNKKVTKADLLEFQQFMQSRKQQRTNTSE
ncbi:helix-turn-helix transcriptional regulator [Bacillus sp. REN10]|uniref:helix-turn-helix domain-containing protein n=1 Tax=Bacillus sp. REN10 TaxID=2782541 RepID=UPI00193C6C67|nr:helix-turn-helix transcriptional regulator [Bacillus sp. REN10]